MSFLTFLNGLNQQLIRTGKRIEQRFERWSQPTHVNLLRGTIMDLTRSKSELMAENAFLRQQVIILRPQTKRPALTLRDRGLLVLLASRLRTWKETLLIVKPDTLLRWHRQGFRWFWRQKSQAKTRQPRIAPVLIALQVRLRVRPRCQRN
jgi:putative transposase